jgi:hypothetical protein
MMISIFAMTMAVGPPAAVAYAQMLLNKYERILVLPLLILTMQGLSLNNAWADIQALRGRKSEFVRTPKFGNDRNWASTTYALELSSTTKALPEIFMFSLLCAAFIIGPFYVPCHIANIPWIAFFACSFLAIIVFHVIEDRDRVAAMVQAQKAGRTAENFISSEA